MPVYFHINRVFIFGDSFFLLFVYLVHFRKNILSSNYHILLPDFILTGTSMIFYSVVPQRSIVAFYQVEGGFKLLGINICPNYNIIASMEIISEEKINYFGKEFVG